MKNIGIFVPGRVASQRCPLKLVYKMKPDDKTLWDIACEKLEILSEYYSVYTLTSDFELQDLNKKYSSITHIKRDHKTSINDSPLSFVFKDVDKMDNEYLMFLNPCLPDLPVETITTCLNFFQKGNFDSATSVKKFQNWVINKEGQNLNKMDLKTLSTKTIDDTFVVANAFHIFNKNTFLETGEMLHGKIQYLEIQENESFDIDHLDELKFYEFKRI